MPILVVQMGHVGRTSGATGAPGEQAFTQTVGNACSALLNRGGWQVRLIPADPPSSYYRGDAFVAVHADGNNNPDVSGCSVGYRNSAGQGLAHAWRDAYIRRGGPKVWHPDNYTTNLGQYYGTGTAVAQGNSRACIIECGTITNPADRALMTGPGGPERVALAIGEALGLMPSAPVTQEDTLDPLNNAHDDAVIGRIDAFVHASPVVTFGRLAGVDKLPIVDLINSIRADVTSIKAGVGALSDDEANVLAAIRGVQVANVDEESLAAALAPLLAPLIQAGATVEQFEAALRRVFADAGQA